METKKKRGRLSSVQRLEQKLLNAVREKKSIKIITTFLDRLHRAGVHEGYAVDAAKKTLLTR